MSERPAGVVGEINAAAALVAEAHKIKVDNDPVAFQLNPDYDPLMLLLGNAVRRVKFRALLFDFQQIQMRRPAFVPPERGAGKRLIPKN